jgi:hypothetical protein
VGLKSVAAPALTPARTTHGPWKVGAAFPKQYMLMAVGHSIYTSGRLACSLYPTFKGYWYMGTVFGGDL